MSSAKGSGGEIDAIKAFILIMAVLTVGLFIYSVFFLKSQLADLEKANARAKGYCERLVGRRVGTGLATEVNRFLDAYSEAKKAGGISSPEEYVDLVVSNSRIDSHKNKVKLDARRETGRTRDYREKYELVSADNLSWDEVLRFMWNFEHNSPKYRILSIDELRRTEAKSTEDSWKLQVKAAYRTQK